jgi:hypothetical protein
MRFLYKIQAFFSSLSGIFSIFRNMRGGGM